jgi:hypothetical protein
MSVSGPVETQAAEDARLMSEAKALGFTYVPQERPQEVEPVCLIWPENLPVFELWTRVFTQWRRDPEGRLVGLDYAAVVALGGLHWSRKQLAEIMDDLRVIELEFMRLLRVTEVS